jgi:hypothetical protein
MSKQTAIEWLLEQLNNYDSKMIELFNKEIEQAKEMEKQQIIDACNQIEVIGLDHELPGKKYYNQNFNK